MIRLLRVELTRAVWRRAVLLLLAAMVVVPIVIGIFTITGHQEPGGDAYDRAVAQAKRDGDNPGTRRELQRCLDNPARYGVPPDDDPQETCASFVLPQPEWYLYDILDLRNERESGSGFGVAVVVAVLAMLVGTTFVGHDWNTGSMSNQLLFEPRRLRVWSAKAAAVVLLTATTAAVATTLFWLLLATRFWTSDASIPDGVLLDGLQQGWRGAAVAGGAGLGGYALTMLSRSTVFTLGLLFGVSVVGGVLIGTLVDDRGWVDPALNATAVISDGTSYEIEHGQCGYATMQDDVLCYEVRERSATQGVVYLAVLLGAGCAASVASYRRRDVP